MESSLGRVGIPCGFTVVPVLLDLFFELLIVKDFECHVENSGVVKNDYATIRSRLYVYSHVNAEVII